MATKKNRKRNTSSKKNLKKSARDKAASAQSRQTSYVYMLINTLVWGASLVIIKPAFEFTTPTRFLMYRYALASILMLPLLWRERQRLQKLGTKIWQFIGVEMIGSVLALVLVYEGLKRTSAIEAGLITTAQPIFIIIGGMLFLHEKQERHEWFGVLIALVATLYLTVLPLVSQGTPSTVSIIGNLLVLGYPLANMFYFPLAKKVYTGVPKLFAASISFWTAGISFAMLALFESWRLSGSAASLLTTISSDLQSIPVLTASGYMAVFGSIIGLTAYIKGQQGIETSEASFFQYLQPLVYIPLAVIFLNEHITFEQIIALGVLVLGVSVAEIRFSNSGFLRKAFKPH